MNVTMLGQEKKKKPSMNAKRLLETGNSHSESVTSLMSYSLQKEFPVNYSRETTLKRETLIMEQIKILCLGML